MIINPNSLHFLDSSSGILQQNIWQELKFGLWKYFSIENQISNNNIPANQPHLCKSVFSTYIPIYPGTKWNATSQQVEEDLYFPTLNKITKEQFYKICESFFLQYKNKKIAVHLSGGLDSSIIICLLHYFGIPFYLVGLKSNRFEFRTEKIIQEKLAVFAVETVLIDIDDYPSFSKLSIRSAHQLPDGNIKQIEAGKAIAKACKKLGVEVVFSGQGGDTILAEALQINSNPWGCNIGNEFLMNYEAEYLYPDHDLELVSFYADKQIIGALYNLRFGQPDDPLKRWARHFFKDILPSELANYTYCADFFGTSMDGLEKAKPEIETLFKTAYEITNHSIFSKKGIAKMLSTDVFDFGYKTYTDFCNRISIAVWYNSLFTGGII